MRVSTNLALALATLLFVLLLVPRAALAQTSSNCPIEPYPSPEPIAPGEVFAGTNCNLYADGDVDSFVFNGTSGDTYELAAAINGSAPTNMCLTLYSPSAVQIFSGCTDIAHYPYPHAVVTDQKLTATGKYYIDITEPSTAKLNYAVALQQLFPFPSYATPVPKWEDPLTGTIAPITDSNLFTFPAATTGTYRVTATLPSTASQNVCMWVYFSNFTSAGSGCTDIAHYPYPHSVQIDLTPNTAEAGQNMAYVQEGGNDGTVTYTLEVSCLVGTCPEPPPQTYPPCTLTDSATYKASTSTLTMNFNVGNDEGTTGPAATWSAWLTYDDTVVSLFPTVSVPSQPNTVKPVPVTKTYSGLLVEGTVGVLSTLSTPKQGIVCSSLVQVNTGTEP